MPARHLQRVGADLADARIRRFAALWHAVVGLPRHLGQHSGGMVLCAGRLDEVVPLEPATMPGRVVVQWDKDDCADLGIIKVDLLGLGMMAALEEAIELCRAAGREVDLAHLPPDDPAVYRLLQAADTVGLFQVESRAQMATLPRLRPRRFYDLVVQVAIIRPGPIIGQMVHPYLARRAGRQPVVYPHPSLEPILRRTLGVPLFQEQLLRMGMVAARAHRRRGGGAPPGLRLPALAGADADDRGEAPRRASRRNGITGPAAEEIVRAITAFAEYGFPESHAASFALLAYASAYLKVHHPAEFYAALLNNQPMGFYHPATVVRDALRRGQAVRPVDVGVSAWRATVEAGAVRLGLGQVKGLREAAAARLVAARQARAFTSVDDLAARAGLSRDELTALAEVGALGSLGLRRRAALWQAERAARPPGPLFAGHAPAPERSPLREMTVAERLVADYRGTGVTVGPHPMALRRPDCARLGVTPAAGLAARATRRARPGRRRGGRAPAAGHGEGVRVPLARGRDGDRQRHRGARALRAGARHARPRAVPSGGRRPPARGRRHRRAGHDGPGPRGRRCGALSRLPLTRAHGRRDGWDTRSGRIYRGRELGDAGPAPSRDARGAIRRGRRTRRYCWRELTVTGVFTRKCARRLCAQQFSLLSRHVGRSSP